MKTDFLGYDKVKATIVYIDGSFGIGKTTTVENVMSKSKQGQQLFFKEPLKYWCNYFEEDLLKMIYEAQQKFTEGLITKQECDSMMASGQLWFSAPYLDMNDILEQSLVGSTPYELPGVDNLVVFDRHPASATVIFPLARHVAGLMSIKSVVNMMHVLPRITRIQNLILLDLDIAETFMRIYKRDRSAEQKINGEYLIILRNIFRLFFNTVAYCKYHHLDWLEEWCLMPTFQNSQLSSSIRIRPVPVSKDPKITETIFQIYKQSITCDDDKQPKLLIQVALTKLVSSLKLIRPAFVNIDGWDKESCSLAVGTLIEGFQSVIFDKQGWRLLADFNKLYKSQNDTAVVTTSADATKFRSLARKGHQNKVYGSNN